ncbi:MAG: PLP-dependent cysteine synthase family protein [Panacagrimonas sp.]
MANILELIGNTPLVEVKRMDTGRCSLYLKLENQNPGGSIKDRIALAMIEDAERSGVLKKGGLIVEATAGNTGLGLALVAVSKGYRLLIVVPDKMSQEKIFHLKAMGAEVVLTRSDVTKGHPEYYQDLAARLARENRAFYVNQFGNPANPLAHYETTGPEILADCPELDVFVAGLGTSGTLMGVGRYLKERKPGVRIVAVEPPAGEDVQGLRSLEEGYIPPIFDPDVLDRRFVVRLDESVTWTRRLAELGIFAGLSSGAVMAGAAKVAATMDKGTIVALLPDGGWKYLSTGAWTDDIDAVVERARRIIYF